MAAFNNGFPATYQQMYPNPYQYQYQQMQQQQTKHVEAIPVDTVEEASSCPMAAGSSGVFFARDDSFIAVKSVGVNGQVEFNVYDKRPPAPPEPAFDPAAYVTKEELEARLAALSGSRKAKKEAVEE